MFSFRNKRRLVKKSENLNKYGPFFIIFPLPIMLKFTVHITAAHLFTCVAKAVTSRRSRELICPTSEFDWQQQQDSSWQMIAMAKLPIAKSCRRLTKYGCQNECQGRCKYTAKSIKLISRYVKLVPLINVNVFYNA